MTNTIFKESNNEQEAGINSIETLNAEYNLLSRELSTVTDSKEQASLLRRLDIIDKQTQRLMIQYDY